MLSLMRASSTLIGVAIACAGNVLISLALTVQKLAHSQVEAQAKERALEHSLAPSQIKIPRDANHIDIGEGDHAPGSSTSDTLMPPDVPSRVVSSGDLSLAEPHVDEGAYLSSPMWWLGLGMIAIGEGGNFLSYGFAPASVVAPLGTVALIANCVFAPLILGESFTKRNVLGMCLAILGAVTVVWSSSDSNRRLSPDELREAVLAPVFLIYTALNILLLVPLTWLSSQERWGGKYIGIDVGTCALFGGYTVMATKALSSLLSSMLLGAFRYAIAWAAVLVLVVTSVLQIKFLNRALMRFESKEVIPTQFVFFSLSAIIGSAVLYQEFNGLDSRREVNFAFGMALTFLGVYFLTTPGFSGFSSATAPTDFVPQQSSVTLAPVDEETPLLFSPDRRPSGHLRPNPSLTSNPAIMVPSQRLTRRTSANNLSLALNSQAGVLLLGTTPQGPGSPLTAPTLALFRGERERGSRPRSASRDGSDGASGVMSTMGYQPGRGRGSGSVV